MEEGRREETVNRIKESAICEFLEKGYSKASLRSICQRAHVTTGAFYFSFQSKEELLSSILAPLAEMYETMIVSFREMETAHPEMGVEIDRRLMGFLMEHRREAIIMLEKCEGSCYAGYSDKVRAMMFTSFHTYFTKMLGHVPDERLLNILVSERLQGCIEIIKGDYDMKDAMYLVEKTGIYAKGGTDKLIEDLLKKEHH